MAAYLSDLDREAKRIKQWAEFLAVLFGLSTILTLLFFDVWSLAPTVTVFAWGMWTLHKDAMALDRDRAAERRYRTWQNLQTQERGRHRTEAEAIAQRLRDRARRMS